MRHIYYCGKCGFTGSESDACPKPNCPECKIPLYFTKVPLDDWRGMTQSEKLFHKEEWKDIIANETADVRKKVEYTYRTVGEYEYTVVTILNKQGEVNTKKMTEILMQHAQMGWRLHTAYSSEIGKNMISIFGFGLNNTACENVLIFERKLK